MLDLPVLAYAGANPSNAMHSLSSRDPNLNARLAAMARQRRPLAVISTSPLNLKSPLIAVEDIKVGSGYWGVFGGSVGRCERTIAELPRR